MKDNKNKSNTMTKSIVDQELDAYLATVGDKLQDLLVVVEPNSRKVILSYNHEKCPFYHLNRYVKENNITGIEYFTDQGVQSFFDRDWDFIEKE